MDRPEPLSDAVRRHMETQRRVDTNPEMALRRALFAAGARYRVAYPVPGRPRRTIDIAFPGRKVAVFVDGCFWHNCPEHAVPPKNNADWWGQKLQRNVERDRDTDLLLTSAGWRVLRFWEHEDLDLAAARVIEELGR